MLVWNAEKDKRCNLQQCFFGWICCRQISIFAKPTVPQYQSGYMCSSYLYNLKEGVPIFWNIWSYYRVGIGFNFFKAFDRSREPANNYQMPSAFSLAVNLPGSNGQLLASKSTRRPGRAEVVVVAPKKRTSTHKVPELSKQGIPLTDLIVREIVKRQSTDKSAMLDTCQKPQFHPMFLEEAYDRCRNICAEYAKTFYLGITSILFFPSAWYNFLNFYQVLN